MPESKTLRFYARGDEKLYEPKRPSVSGAPRYIGRLFVRAKVDGNGKVLEPSIAPATEKPWEVDPESDAGKELLVDLRRAALRATKKEEALGIHHLPLWPADEETAKALGVPFVAVKFDGGAWVDPDAEKKRATLKGMRPKAMPPATGAPAAPNPGAKKAAKADQTIPA